MLNQPLMQWLAIGGVALAGSALWRLLRPSRSDSQQRSKPNGLPTGTGNAPSELEVLNPPTLIAQLQLQGDINAIAELIGLSRANFATDILPTLHAVVDFVQLLPASEAHHHANPGGLAQHAIDVTRRALAIRGGREIPVGCSPEERAKRKHRWSVGVFLAALFHDIGKPITDVTIHFTDSKSGTRRRWQALTGSMKDMGVATYQVSFPSTAERDYRAHEKLGVVLLQRCVPQHVLAWLGEDGELMPRLYGMLAGDSEAAGVIAEIVRQADMESTAHNLKHGSRQRFASAQQTPLIEVLMQRLRHLLSHADGVSVPLNASGAAGFICGEHTWLVVPRVVDLLIDEVKRVEPTRSLPSDRTRIFDTFREFDAIDPRPGTTQSVWKIRVRGGDESIGSDFVHELSALRFRTTLLFRSVPAQFSGHVEAMGATDVNAPAPPSSAAVATSLTMVNATKPHVSTPTPAEASAIASVAVSTLATLLTPELPAKESSASSTPTSCNPGSDNAAIAKVRTRLPSPGAKEVMPDAKAVTSGATSVASDEPTSAGDLLDQLLGTTTASANAPTASETQVQIAAGALQSVVAASTLDDTQLSEPEIVDRSVENAPLPPVAVPHPTKKSTGSAIGPLASGFLRWLQEGLAQQTIDCNGANAFFHTLEEGVGLVSPRAFQIYAASLSGEILPNQKLPKELSQAVISTVSKIQSELKKSKVVRPNGDKPRPDYFHAYVISSSQKRINMMLIDEPSQFFSTLPPANRMLARAAMQSIS